MGDHQCQRVGVGVALVEEVNIAAIDLGDELIETVQPLLTGPPVVVIGPVRGQFAGVVQGHPLAPVPDTLTIRPAGPVQSVPQIDEVGIGDPDPERSDIGHVSDYRARCH